MSESTIPLPKSFAYIKGAIQPGIKPNPHRSEVEPASYAWFDSHGVDTGEKRQEFIDSKTGLLLALVFPNEDASRFRNLLDFSLWWFCFQSMAEGGGLSPETIGVVDEILRVVYNPGAPLSNLPLAAMVQSCFQRMIQDASPPVIQRFVTGLEDYLQAFLQPKSKTSDIPTLEECMVRRRGAVGKNLWAAVLQYAHGLDLPDQVVNHQSFIEFSDAAADLCTLTEDIYSSIRGVQGAYSTNIVSAAMQHDRLERNDAIDLLDPLVQRRMDEYQDLKTKLPSFGLELDNQVAKYLQCTDHNILAIVEWAYLTSG